MTGSGGDSRENAGISNEKAGAIPARRKPKVSRVKAIDGKLVYNPILNKF